MSSLRIQRPLFAMLLGVLFVAISAIYFDG
jgi:hypothetical protein